MEVTLRYFDGCPHWQATERALRTALDSTGRADVLIDHELVETVEEAERLGFVGSPTVLVDGVDPFATPDASPGLACRIYNTPQGRLGSPTLGQLRDVLR